MRVVDTVAALRAARGEFGTLGLVPTMGALHEGHLSLVRRARAENGAVAATIFVNPTQFGPNEDLSRYPRTLADDLALLEAERVDLVFVPDPAEMYPPGFSTRIEPGVVAAPLEGAIRPGHFTGVATVVVKLLNMAQPTRAYFGQKDAQQVAVIRRVSRDLDLPWGIVVADTVREPDGLALSSRNRYLSPAGRAAAAVLFRALRHAEALFVAGERDGNALRGAVRAVLATEPAGTPDYVSLADPDDLRELDRVSGTPALLSLAVRFGATRLLDNLILRPPPAPTPPA
ncbi:MAG: pantoate--beta-alanine ligase [Gluconacetobacter diazotrophicus]|nr:pantoate--beta-alanine ligase [Gluconacetobacter diazotrophicus]